MVISYEKDKGLSVDDLLWIPSENIVVCIDIVSSINNLVYAYENLSLLFINNKLFVCKDVYNAHFLGNSIVIGVGCTGIYVKYKGTMDRQDEDIDDWVPFDDEEWSHTAKGEFYELFIVEYSCLW